MGRWKQSGDDTGPKNRSETNSELEIRNSQLCPGLCSKDPQTNNSMERVITLPSLRSLGLQLKCFELVLLPKAAPPALQTPPRHTLGTPRRYRPAARKAGLAHVAQASVSAIGENEKVGSGRKRRSLSFGSCAE